MDWLLFSYYSPGVFFDSLISFVIVTFLILKKEKVRSTYWLIGFFLGELSLFLAYTASYSIFAEFGAYHRYVSCLVMFGNACLVGFAYAYPKNDRPKESIFVIALSFLMAILNVLVKSDKISYGLYALLFSFSTMIVIYYIAIVYINNSPEPTSFMVKLVGISLGAILFVLGFVGEITLSESEVNYDQKRLLQVTQTRNALTEVRWTEIPEAISILYSAFQIDRTHEKLSRLLGTLLYRSKDYKKAIEVFNSYLSQFDQDEELLYYLAISLKKMELYQEGIKVSNRLFQINPNLVRNILNLADLHRLIGDSISAIEYSNQVLEMEPSNEIAKKILLLYPQSS